MSLDWGGGLFGAAPGSSALDELQKVGSRKPINIEEEPEPWKSRFQSDEDEIDDLLGDKPEREALGEVAESSSSKSSNGQNETSATRISASSRGHILKLYSGVTLRRTPKIIKSASLRLMEQQEESLQNHYGVDVSGIRQGLLEKKLQREDQLQQEEEMDNVENVLETEILDNSFPSFSDSNARAATLCTGLGARDPDLWVEKLRPSKLLDLNGHSDRHKDILYWLSEWNSFIFQTPSSAVQFRAKQKEQWLKKSGKIQDAVLAATETRDSVSRPQKRILLVHGEPGTGKTTACTVLARHLGFNTLEMNASDDRGSEAFRRGVLGPMRTHSVTSKDRPNCIILDEIDGADPVFIDKLVKFVERDEREELWNQRKRHKSKKDKTSVLVSRPIICIANNLHGVLYRLRPHCRIVNYGRLSNSQSLRIVQNVFRTQLNLTTLTSKQNRFLHDICASTDGDIRQAINILQFGSPDGPGASAVDKSALWSNIVVSLFSNVPQGKQRVCHVENICQRSLRCGEWNKLVFGAFSTYLETFAGAGVLSTLNNIHKASDWYHLYDLNEKLGGRDLYNPYMLASFSLLFGNTQKCHIEAPQTDYHLVNKTQTQQLRLAHIHDNMPVEMRQYMNKATLVSDLGLYFDILAKQQKGLCVEQMACLADSLMSLGITLRKESVYNDVSNKREDVYVFMPPITELTPSYNTFLETLHKLVVPDPTQKRPGEFSQVQVHKKKPRKDTATETQTKTSITSTSPKPRKTKTSTLFDFFVKDKTVEVTPSQAARQSSEEEKDTLSVWVSYFEGYSNAVRRDLTWEQLWME